MTPTRHRMESAPRAYWGSNLGIAICGARRAPGVVVQQSSRGVTCRECAAVTRARQGLARERNAR